MRQKVRNHVNVNMNLSIFQDSILSVRQTKRNKHIFNLVLVFSKIFMRQIIHRLRTYRYGTYYYGSGLIVTILL